MVVTTSVIVVAATTATATAIVSGRCRRCRRPQPPPPPSSLAVAIAVIAIHLCRRPRVDNTAAVLGMKGMKAWQPCPMTTNMSTPYNDDYNAQPAELRAARCGGRAGARVVRGDPADQRLPDDANVS